MKRVVLLALGNHIGTLFNGTVQEDIQGAYFVTTGLVSGHYTVVVTDAVGVVGSVPIVIIK